MKIIKNEKIEFDQFWKQIKPENEVIRNHFLDYINLKKSSGEEKLIRYIKFWGLDLKILELNYLIIYFNLLFHNKKPLKFEEVPINSGKNKQFVYATKLIHTFDETTPPLDAQVEKYLGIERGKDLAIYYQQFCEDFQVLLKNYNEELKKTRKLLRDKMDINTNLISDTKLLDSVIWCLSTLRR